MVQKFKKITVETSSPIDTSRRKFVDEFFDEFNGHIYIEPITENKFNLFLNRLDFKQFELSANRVKSEQLCRQNAEIINDIFTAVNNVKSYGLKSGKRIYADYNIERKVKNRNAKAVQRTESRILVENKQENSLPARFQNKIICGDSLKVLSKLPDNCIDLVLTSPPYNFGLSYRESDDTHDWSAYFDKLFEILEQAHRVLKHGGRLIINVQPLFSDYIPTHHVISNRMVEIGMLWKGEILWEKNNYNCKYTAWGSWKSPSSPYLKYTWEFIEIFCKGSLKHPGEKSKIDINDTEFKKWVYAKWSMSPERKMKEYGHPAMFPEELAERAMKLFSYQDDVVLDPFNGVGTTTAVAKKLNRRHLGIDISKDYCAVARKRIKDAAG